MGSLSQNTQADGCDAAVVLPTVRILVAGGSYAGLSTVVNLLDLGRGLTARMSENKYKYHPELGLVNWDITVVDERDGFCKQNGPSRSPTALI